MSGEMLRAALTGYHMDVSLTVVLAVGILLFYTLLVYMLARHALILKYTIIWMASGFVLVVFLLFPGTVLKLSDLIGVTNPVNAVFLMFAGVALMLLLTLTSIVSQLSSRARRLTQSVALLEKRVRELEQAAGTQDAGAEQE